MIAQVEELKKQLEKRDEDAKQLLKYNEEQRLENGDLKIPSDMGEELKMNFVLFIEKQKEL